MKMLKKLLAVVLTGAMALTLFTACGGNAVNDKDIADALNDMAKGSLATYTFKSRTDEQAMAKAIAALSESDRNMKGSELPPKVKEILGINENGANANNFVWYGAVFADEIGTAGQAYNVMNNILSQKAVNADKLDGKEPGDIRYIGTALGTMTFPDGQKTVRFIVVTAEAK